MLWHLVNPGYGPIALNDGVSISVLDLFANGANGLLLDFVTMGDLIVLNSGSHVPVSAVGNSIGLAFDKHAWNGASRTAIEAAAPNLVTNGTFDADANWTKGTGWSIGSGIATHAVSGSNGSLTSTSFTATALRFYKFVMDIVNSAAVGAIVPGIGAGSGVTVNANGTHPSYIKAPTASAPFIFGGLTFDGAVDNITVQYIEGNHALQATSGARPTYRATGARFDASDDNLLTEYLAQAGANCIIAKLTVPATLAATQVICGASGAGANRCYLAVNTSGQLCGGVGSDDEATIKGSNDLRGQTVYVGLAFDGTTVRLFEETAEVYTGAQNSTPTTTIPFRIGAKNDNGTAAAFSGADIEGIVVGRQMLTLAQFRRYRTQLQGGFSPEFSDGF